MFGRHSSSTCESVQSHFWLSDNMMLFNISLSFAIIFIRIRSRSRLWTKQYINSRIWETMTRHHFLFVLIPMNFKKLFHLKNHQTLKYGAISSNGCQQICWSSGRSKFRVSAVSFVWWMGVNTCTDVFLVALIQFHFATLFFTETFNFTLGNEKCKRHALLYSGECVDGCTRHWRMQLCDCRIATHLINRNRLATHVNSVVVCHRFWRILNWCWFPPTRCDKWQIVDVKPMFMEFIHVDSRSIHATCRHTSTL